MVMVFIFSIEINSSGFTVSYDNHMMYKLIKVEVMGTLNNLTYLEALHDSLLLNSGLLHYLSTQLHASNQEDDINLQVYKH
mgnify:FL=1